MKLSNARRRQLSIVLIGDFNPSIFHPIWFAKHGIALDEDQAKNAELKICHSEVTSFEMSWMSLNVTGNKFSISSLKESSFETLRDIVLQTFDLLYHTPIQSMGINNSYHFQVADEEEWHRIGDDLVPKGRWKEVLSGRPGMEQLVIKTVRENGDPGHLKVQVEPSNEIHPGVYFQVNDHFEVEELQRGEVDSTQIMDMLKTNFVGAMERADEIVSELP